MTLQADLRALQIDADTWSDISAVLSTSASNARLRWLGTDVLSWAAEVTGLTTTYADFCDHVADRLDEGSTNTAEMAGGLRTVREAFIGTDGSAANRFDGAWDAVSE